jgi:hypothetical protein
MDFDSRKRDKLADAPIKNPDFCSYNDTNLYRRRNNAIDGGVPFPQGTLPEWTLYNQGGIITSGSTGIR